jgi:hypothetical protein
VGAQPGPPVHRQAYREIGSLQTLAGQDKTFVVERRGGYPWAEGYFNRNDDAPLPLPLVRGSACAALRVRISDDLARNAPRLKQLVIRAVLCGAADDEQVEITCNGAGTALLVRDPAWKDPQIFSPRPQPASGGPGEYPVDPAQRLLRLDFTVDPAPCRQGENLVGIRLGNGTQASPADQIALEKLEVHLQCADGARS